MSPKKKTKSHYPLNDFLKKLRLKYKMSQENFAKILGLKQYQFVSNIERNISSPPLYWIPMIADTFELKEKELYRLWDEQYDLKRQKRVGRLQRARQKTIRRFGWLERLDLQTKKKKH